ncbi:MAG TPA: hypothetical protein IGR64_00540, partial [Leptolyngbyaceae cyanobacterium M65_K2018_010]|nr:hypothetical protein [Leptolyngbyaceae cyanobacterium M65_K2018_010]
MSAVINRFNRFNPGRPGRPAPSSKLWRLGLALLAIALLPLTPLAGRAGVEPLPLPRASTANLSRYPNLKPYDLGTLSFTQPGVAAPWQTMPLPLTGVIGLPHGAGPWPWVVIWHGRHGGCHFAPEGKSQWPCPAGEETRYDQGFAYLAQALTEAGYGVLIPNLNGAFSDTYGATPQTRSLLADQRSQALVDAHLSQLAIANQGQSTGFGLSLNGLVDWSRLAMVGHSMGGGAAALNAFHRQGRSSAAEIQAGLGPVAALVLVSPTRSYPIQQGAEVYQLADSPTAVLLGGCDRDIVDLSSFYYFET